MMFTIRILTGALLAWIERTFECMSARKYHNER